FWIKHVVGRYERKGYAEPDLVLVNYESVRKMFFDQFGAGAEVRIVPYSSESAFLREEAQEGSAIPKSLAALHPADAPLIVSVSRHDPRKGVDILLRALAKLRDAGTPFRACLVGGGHLLDAHRLLAEQLGLGDRVTIEGWVPDPRPYLREADIYVLPSLQEGSGSVSLIEALQAGVAVVASNIDGIPEDVGDGESALLVEPGNSAALCDALKRLAHDPDLRRRLARQSRETFIAKFQPDHFAKALREIYAELGFEAEH
ncbi:MAG: glycosyltransferase family 4 protein, partial [Blastocatellia bacterium]